MEYTGMEWGKKAGCFRIKENNKDAFFYNSLYLTINTISITEISLQIYMGQCSIYIIILNVKYYKW